jgi:hypothetical protein
MRGGGGEGSTYSLMHTLLEGKGETVLVGVIVSRC